MEHIGTYEVIKNDLPNIAIMNPDNYIAISTPLARKKKYDTAINKLKEFGKNKRLDGLNLKSLIQEGRD